MWKRPLRLGVYVLVGFVIGSLILGTIKGNPFVTNLVYGLWTGAIAVPSSPSWSSACSRYAGAGRQRDC
jgi:hypothetical protein